MTDPDLRDLAFVGDRRSVAALDTRGTVHWYCPERFDRPAVLSSLVDPASGGRWTVDAGGAAFSGRRYLGDSGVLETRFESGGAGWRLTDFMPMAPDIPSGLCRLVSAAPRDVEFALRLRPDYGRRAPRLTGDGETVLVDGLRRVAASHALRVDAETIRCTIPAGVEGWMALVDRADVRPATRDVSDWLGATVDAWRVVIARATYRGPYEEQVAASVRALRLLTYEPTGAIVAAPTTSLPEVVGGTRNYDYRYAWLRDVGMIVSALTRVGSDGREERRFLEFVCGARSVGGGLVRAPFYAVDGAFAPPEEDLGLPGWRGSRPVRAGNGAREQFQLDAYGNVLLAAKLIYGRFGTREHWPVVSRFADLLAERWREPDYGIWEEREPKDYTTGKVLAACALEYIAEHSEDAAQAARWRTAASEIRAFVDAHGRRADGAYTAVVGEEAVDVSAALFPVWAYEDPDTPAMEATMAAIERDLGVDGLYRRHLACADGQEQEGAFLAGSLWVAQYWVMRDPARARAILDRVVACATDLGFFSEEVDPRDGTLLGNLPQTFVHASFIGAVYDLKNTLDGSA